MGTGWLITSVVAGLIVQWNLILSQMGVLGGRLVMHSYQRIILDNDNH